MTDELVSDDSADGEGVEEPLVTLDELLDGDARAVRESAPLDRGVEADGIIGAERARRAGAVPRREDDGEADPVDEAAAA